MKLRTLFPLLLALAPLAVAGNITVSYSGAISQSDLPGVSAGDSFTGYFTYTVASPVVGGNPTEVVYSMDQSGDGIFFTVDGYWFAAGPSLTMEMSVWPNYPTGVGPADLFEVEQGGPIGAAFSTNYDGGFTFIQSFAQILGDTGFLPSFAPPAPFYAGDVIFGGLGGVPTVAEVALEQGTSDYTVAGNFENIQASEETPEPAAFGLFGIGLALLLAGWIRRPRTA